MVVDYGTFVGLVACFCDPKMFSTAYGYVTCGSPLLPGMLARTLPTIERNAVFLEGKSG